MEDTNCLKSEIERLDELNAYALLDTPRDPYFDRITRLAACIFEVPVSLISFVGADHIWFKSAFGLEHISWTERCPGLCSSAILDDALYVVEDALSDPRTSGNPLVTGAFGLRFYAAAPLKTAKGSNIGALSIIDRQPRKFPSSRLSILHLLADMLMSHIELSRGMREQRLSSYEATRAMVHDLKNPLTIITLQTELMELEQQVPPEIREACSQVNRAGKKMTGIINALLALMKERPRDNP